MVRHRKPPSHTWRTFLENHIKQLVSVDFFVVSTLSFRILHVFVVLAHERRRVVHFKVTEHPTAEFLFPVVDQRLSNPGLQAS
jgi:putative transposase